jgi:putative SOS response-associated peptidase YedK
MYIRLASGEPFAFGGLWEEWHSLDGSTILSCTIITTEPNELAATIHNRMPLILPEEAYATWLEPGDGDPAPLTKLLKPYPASKMEAYPVSTLVNSPANDIPEIVQPIS